MLSTSLLLTLSVGVLLIAFLCYGVYASNSPKFVKLMALPVSLVFLALVGVNFYQNLGAPRPWMPDGEWVYIAHETDGNTIHLWITGSDGMRLHVFPYSEENQKALEKADEAKQQGVQMTGQTQEGLSDSNESPRISMEVGKLPPKN